MLEGKRGLHNQAPGGVDANGPLCVVQIWNSQQLLDKYKDAFRND
jgi:hypothetical protein